MEIFFVISGYLITTLLLREHEATGRISLRNFYLRRAWRILPPYYFYICAVVVLGVAGLLQLRIPSATSAALFLWNYVPYRQDWFFDHLWSLAVEEQFYLIWPLALITALGRGHRRVAVNVALIVVLISPAIRIIAHLLGSNSLYYMFHTRADALMFGALAALGLGLFERLYKMATPYVWLAVPYLLLVSPYLTGIFGGSYLYTVGFTLEGLTIVVTMLWLIRNTHTSAAKILNSAFMIYIGTLSYSIYLWQNLFLMNSSFTGLGLVNFILVGACSLFSYYAIEKPALRYRTQHIPSAT